MRKEPRAPGEGRQAGGAWKATLLVILMVAAGWAACFGFPRVWTAMGADVGHKVFLDLDGMLAAGEAAQRGINPFRPNPLDIYHRPHVYTEWWLATGRIGLTRQDTAWLGGVLAGLTLLAGALLIRPVNRREAGLALLVLLSPALLLAINRANNDLVAFILMCGAFALLRQPGAAPRVLGIMLLALAAVLKYYPLAAAVVLLDARTRRECLGWLGVFGLVVLLAWPALAPGLQSAAKYRPSPDWLYAFGAPVIFRDFSLPVPPEWLLLGGGLALAAWAARGAEVPVDAPGRSSAPAREFAGGAALLVGCFALGSSYVYKLVFAVWLLPWLWRSGAPAREDRWRRATLGLLLAVLWLEGLLSVVINVLISPESPELALGLLKVSLVVSQLLTWALMIALLRSLLLYAARRLATLAGARFFRPPAA